MRICLTQEPLYGELSSLRLPMDLRQAGDERFSLVGLTEAPQHKSFCDSVRLSLLATGTPILCL